MELRQTKTYWVIKFTDSTRTYDEDYKILEKFLGKKYTIRHMHKTQSVKKVNMLLQVPAYLQRPNIRLFSLRIKGGQGQTKTTLLKTFKHYRYAVDVLPIDEFLPKQPEERIEELEQL